MREITEIEELKEIQVNILKHIDELCEKHGLQYFMSDGTLIGAVRHKGYIPWDDDLDIWMPREDYQKLTELMETDGSPYEVVNYKKTPGYIYAFGKAVDTRTILKENIEVQCSMGVYVDIFAYDGLPGHGKEDYIKHVRKCLYLEKQRYRAFQSFKGVKGRHTEGNVKRFIFWAVRRAIGGKNFIRLVEHYSTKYPVKGAEYVGCLDAGYKENQMMPARIFKDTVKLEFEGEMFRAPAGYDEFLTIEYGDYMTLPPVEEQVTHHDFKAWWKDTKDWEEKH